MEFEGHEYAGTCCVCGWRGTFKRTQRAIRETYPCGGCRASLRYQVQAEAILACYKNLDAPTIRDLAKTPAFADLIIFEPGVAGPFRSCFKSLPNYELSFYWSDLKSGEKRDGIRNEDLMNLSYPDSSIDLVITSDIFEHIRRPFDAFREIHRVLKTGGMHIFTIPTTYPLPARTVKRVNVDGPEDVLLMDAVYHGNGKGGRSLVHNDFGADLLTELSSIGLATSLHTMQSKERFVRTASAFISVKVTKSWLLGG